MRCGTAGITWRAFRRLWASNRFVASSEYFEYRSPPGTIEGKKKLPCERRAKGETENVLTDDGACGVEPDRNCGWVPGDYQDDRWKNAGRIECRVSGDDDPDECDGLFLSNHKSDAGASDWDDLAGGSGDCIVRVVFEEAGGRLADGLCGDGSARTILQCAGFDCAVVHEDSCAAYDGADRRRRNCKDCAALRIAVVYCAGSCGRKELQIAIGPRLKNIPPRLLDYSLGA